MKSEARVALHLEKMLSEAKAALSFIDGLDKEAFLGDVKTQHAVAMSLIIVGEAVTKLQRDHADYLARHTAVAWRDMTGMRHRIAHGYYKLNFNIVWDTACQNLPDFVEKLPPMIAELDKKYPPTHLEPGFGS